jgi:hypothetical protein
MSTVTAALNELLTGFQTDTREARAVSNQKALFLARHLQQRATELQTPRSGATG